MRSRADTLVKVLLGEQDMDENVRQLEQFIDAAREYLPTIGGSVTGSQTLEPEGIAEIYTDLGGEGGISFSLSYVGDGVFDAMWDAGTGDYDGERLEQFRTPEEMVKAFGIGS